MISLRRIRSAWFLSLGACTPLGLWLYEDPVVSVFRITLARRVSGPAGSSPVIVVLAVQNRNDYPLSTERLELSLRLDGVPIGQFKRDSTAPVGTNTVSTVAVALPVEKHTTPARLNALVKGSHVFAVRGRATFRTPIGSRRVSFAEEGEIVWSARDGPAE